MTTQTELPPGAQQVRKLTRRRADRKIAGVAAGVADYFDVDAIWIRLLFVLTVFAGGLGLVAYIALWILAPATDEPAPSPTGDGRRVLRRLTSTSAGTIVAALGILLIATMIFESSRGLFWGLALIAIGVFLFRERDARGSEAAGANGATIASSVPPAAGTKQTETAGTGEPPVGGAGVVARAPQPGAPRPKRERSPLGAITFGVLFVVLGGMWLVDTSTDAELRLVQYFSAALLVLGAGIAVGTFVGRARWLVFPAFLLVPALFLANVITLPLEGGIGTRNVNAESFADLESSYQIAAGQLVANFEGLTEAEREEPFALRMTAAVGQITVYLPSDLPVDVRARARLGAVQIQGQQTGGVDVDVSRRVGPEGVSPAMTLDLQTSLGQIRVWSTRYSD